MPPRRIKRPLPKEENESLSEELDDDTEEAITIKQVAKRLKPTAYEQWIDKYEPDRIEDLCINPKKLREVDEALKAMINRTLNCRLLILSGPAGSSKSTCIKLLAKKYLEQHNGSHGSFLKGLGRSVVEFLDTNIEETHRSDQFGDFMDGCKFLVGSNLSVILIEDLPNVFHGPTLASFRNVLRDWVFTERIVPLPPVVICLLEVEMDHNNDSGSRTYYSIENNMTVETLLGRDLLDLGLYQGLIKRIKFLPIARTFMKKTLNKIVSREARAFADYPRKALDEFITQNIETGDIRSLICNLQFWSTHALDISNTRENQISLFHAVGKVIHSSSKFATLDDQESDALSVKSVIEAYSNFGLLHLALLENYSIVNSGDFDINIAASIADSLSINDTIEEVDESKEYAIMATRSHLRKVEFKSGRTQLMKFPRHFKTVRESNKVKREVNDYVRYITKLQGSFQGANLIDGCLLPKIYNLFRYRNMHGRPRFNYNRLGGMFAPILADDELPVMEDEAEYNNGVEDQFKADIRKRIQEENEEESAGEDDDILSDPLSDSAQDTDEDLNDTFDDQKFDGILSSMRLLTTPKPRSADKSFDDLDDPEFDLLVSQGML